MYCPKCGKEVTEGTEFCVNCGTRVGGTPMPQSEGSAALAPEAAPVQKAGSKKKIWIIAAAALVLVIAVGVGAYFLFFSAVKIEGKYRDLYNGEAVYQFSADGTVTKKVSEELNHTYDGKYTVNSGKVVIDWENVQDNETYAMDQGYLVNVDYVYTTGEIPAQGDTFDAVCSRSANKIHDARSFVFHKDGTMELEVDSDSYKGTYERKGNIIEVDFDAASEIYTLFIHDNHLSSTVLQKD